MMRPLLILLLAFPLLHAACNCSGSKPFPPLPPDPPVAPDGGFDLRTEYGLACERLRALGCPEGRHADCDDVMARADARHLTIVPAACIAAAPDRESVRACGFAKCR